MEIWLILNGKRSGPYPDYEIRSRIEHGQMTSEEMVWHEGLPEWTPVGELELFHNSLEQQEQVPEVVPPPLPKAYMEGAASAKPSPYLARRFWARWMDLTFYSGLWWLGMYLGGRDISTALDNTSLVFSMFLPCFAIEAWLIHRIGTTPGKWLMGLKVSNEDGSPLVLKQSIWRGLRVLIIGVGFGWLPLALLCQTMSWFTTKHLGKPIWDYMGKHKVEAGLLSPFRIVVLVAVFIGAIMLQNAVLGPHTKEIMAEMFPQHKELYENNDEWFFPVRK